MMMMMMMRKQFGLHRISQWGKNRFKHGNLKKRKFKEKFFMEYYMEVGVSVSQYSRKSVFT